MKSVALVICRLPGSGQPDVPMATFADREDAKDYIAQKKSSTYWDQYEFFWEEVRFIEKGGNA